MRACASEVRTGHYLTRGILKPLPSLNIPHNHWKWPSYQYHKACVSLTPPIFESVEADHSRWDEIKLSRLGLPSCASCVKHVCHRNETHLILVWNGCTNTGMMLIWIKSLFVTLFQYLRDGEPCHYCSTLIMKTPWKFVLGMLLFRTFGAWTFWFVQGHSYLLNWCFMISGNYSK